MLKGDGKGLTDRIDTVAIGKHGVEGDSMGALKEGVYGIDVSGDGAISEIP